MIQNFPYHITLISLFLPFISANLNMDFHRLLLLFVSLIFIVWLLQSGKTIAVNKSILFFYLLFIVLILIDQILGRGLRNFSYGHSLLYIFIFLQIYLLNIKKISPNLLYHQTDRLFKIIILFLFIETVIIISGNQEFLLKIFPKTGRTSIVEGFGYYNNRFAEYFKLGYMGLNSLISGKQIAGNLVLISMIWFAPIYNYRPKHNANIIWFFLSLSLFIFSPNMTTAILIIVTILFLIFIINVSNLRKIKYLIPVFIFFTIIGIWSIKFIFLPFFSMRVFPPWHPMHGLTVPNIDWYWYGALVHPLNEYFAMPILDILYGSQSLNYGFRVADEIGLLRVTSVIGIPLITMVTIAVAITLFKSISLIKFIDGQKNILEQYLSQYQSYIFLAQVNILIVIIWLLTTIHYLVIFRLGVVTLIAFNFSVSLFSIYSARRIIKLSDITK